MDDFAINELADKSNLFLLNYRVQLFRTTKTSCTHKKADVNKKTRFSQSRLFYSLKNAANGIIRNIYSLKKLDKNVTM